MKMQCKRKSRVKRAAVLAGAVLCFLCICCLLTACASVSEAGEWRLYMLSDGGTTYHIGDEYGGKPLEEDFFTCSFDGASYRIRSEGEMVAQGDYFTEKVSGSQLLALVQGGGSLLWNCGEQVQADGSARLAVTGEWGGYILCFVPA